MKTLLSALLVGALSSALFAESARVGNSLYLKPAFAPLVVAAAEVGSSAEPSGMGTFAQGYADGKASAVSRLERDIRYPILTVPAAAFITFFGSLGMQMFCGIGVNERCRLSMCLLGTVGSVIYFAPSRTPPQSIVPSRGPEYGAGFTLGWKEHMTIRRRLQPVLLTGALLGGAAATAVITKVVD